VPKPKSPVHLRRVLVVARVFPRNLAYLESLGEPNVGRAIDKLCESNRAILKAMKPSVRALFTTPAKLPLD